MFNSFKSTNESEPVLAQPIPIVDASEVKLDFILLEEIEPNVEDNPRMALNEVREELKNSIRSSNGMYVLLEVSRRVGDLKYSLIRGGNTRLELLHELKAEWVPSDAQKINPYQKVRCIVYPWSNDSEKAIMNATENMVRGGLCYGEEAKAVRILKNQYDLTNSGEMLFPEWCKECGLSMALNSSAISRYLYTADVLNIALPKLMIEGRANATTVRWVISSRAGLVKIVKGRIAENFSDNDNDDDSRLQQLSMLSLCNERTDDLLEQVNREVDSETLSKAVYIDKIVELFALQYSPMTDDEKTLMGIIDCKSKLFATAVGIRPKEDFGDDNRKNAALMIHQMLENGQYIKSNRQTRCLTKMGVSDDIGGFIDIIKLLDPKGRKALFKTLAG